jgi:hypothetical protein
MAAMLSIESIRLHLIEGQYRYAHPAEDFGPKTGAHSSQPSGQEEAQWGESSYAEPGELALRSDLCL